MKYLITESQLDRVIFTYLNKQDFIQIKKRNYIFFVNSEGDKYGQIRYDEDEWCYISIDLIKEISSFFSLQPYDSEQVIGRWVENTLQMKVTETQSDFMFIELIVENTLQMKVTETRELNGIKPFGLRIPSN